MGILQHIVTEKKKRLHAVKSGASLHDLRTRIADIEPPRDFSTAISRSGDTPVRLIAEIKKASPSRGVISEDFDHRRTASVYEEKSVDAISVLTEEDFFQGALEFLREVKKVSARPVLRKDFLFDEYQIYESRAYGADAILLIAALLERNQAGELAHLSKELGLSVLFEVHDGRELETALSIDSKIIGINNRNLTTLEVNLQTTFDLLGQIPRGHILVSESGIRTREDVMRLEASGIDALLVGTVLMEARDTGRMIDMLRGKQ